jgi:hypothetical protein
VTGEWRFHFAESLPVPTNGSNLETQVMANPIGLCHASRLCLPLPYLRCQHTFSTSSMVSPHVLCLCLSSPPWAYWDPASLEKLVAWYLMTLVIPTSLPGLSVSHFTKALTKNCGCHAHAVTPPPQGEEGKQTGATVHRMPVSGHSKNTCHS